VERLQSKQIRIIMTTAKSLYGFLLLNDETEEKYPIDLEQPGPYLGFTLSLHLKLVNNTLDKSFITWHPEPQGSQNSLGPL